jgi:hypothetical protein
MAKITGPDKTTGQQHSAAEYNAMKASINAVYDFLFTNGIIGTIKKEALPDAILSVNQFEELPDGMIGMRTDYLQSLNLGGGTALPKLIAPAPLIATAISVSQINLSWPAGQSATSYTLQRSINSNFSGAENIYVGALLAFSNTGLAGNTQYYFRLKSSAQGYYDSDYTMASATTQAPGAITPAAPTNFVVDDNANTGAWTANPLYTSFADYEVSLDGGSTLIAATNPINVGDVNKAIGQVAVRVKAASGRNSSGWLTNATAYAKAPTQPYVVEKTYYVDFANQYGSYPDSPPPFWNVFKPADNVLQVANSFVSPTLIDTNNGGSTIIIKNSGAFGGSTARISTEQDAAGNTGVFGNEAINTAWSISGSTNAKLKISGLLPDKRYQLYFLMPATVVGLVRGVSIAGTTKNKTAATILGSFGLSANGLNDPEWIVFNNISGTEVEAAVSRVSGDFGAFLATMVIEQSNVDKPI